MNPKEPWQDQPNRAEHFGHSNKTQECQRQRNRPCHRFGRQDELHPTGKQEKSREQL